MELPPYFQNVRNALLRSGHTPADAYRITWGAIRRWARGGGKAHPEVVAAAQSALADLKAKSAIAHAHANDGGAVVELAGAWNEALHPRVGAGATAGGQFAKGQQQGGAAKGKPAKAPRQAPRPVTPPGLGQRAARAHQLRAQAATYRQHAATIQAQIRAEIGQIHAAVTAQKTARAAAARGAAARAAGKGKKAVKVRKVSTHPRKHAAVHRSTIASRSAHISNLRQHVALQRRQVRALNVAANRLDAQAAKL
jgi:hypothetical protein